ncbi:conserved hypothetical protein [Burkholderiales bacterium 8X]|nr:conserved hypothetical protein [Burkholderiales bacterium 8X]
MNKKAAPVSARIDDDIDTIPSRLDELTTRSRMEELERNKAGWRRNMLVAILVVLIVVALYVSR